MAKKVASKKKITRTSSMEKTIAEGREYLETSKKKRIHKTRTMVQTIQEAKGINKPKTKKKAVSKKRQVRPARKSLPAKPARKVVAKQAKVSSEPMKTSSKKSMSAAKDSLPIRSDSKLSNKSIGKATKFVKKSINLPTSNYGFIDVCFCIDATGSMSSQLAQAQSTIGAIMDKIQNKVAAEGITLRFAVVTYRDHPPQDTSYVTKILDFTDHHQAITHVKKLDAWGGGDQPQAVHDGLLDCCEKLNWVNLPGTPVLRYIFHIADAPPHGKQFDTYESKQGCLCGKQTQDIIRAINRKQIHYRLIKVRKNVKVDKMQSIFKKGIVDFDSTDIANAREMDVRVSEMIIHEILPDFA